MTRAAVLRMAMLEGLQAMEERYGVTPSPKARRAKK
jgi:hypothetical protein